MHSTGGEKWNVKNRGDKTKRQKGEFGKTGRDMKRWMRQRGRDRVIGEEETGEMVR